MPAAGEIGGFFASDGTGDNFSGPRRIHPETMRLGRIRLNERRPVRAVAIYWARVVPAGDVTRSLGHWSLGGSAHTSSAVAYSACRSTSHRSRVSKARRSAQVQSLLSESSATSRSASARTSRRRLNFCRHAFEQNCRRRPGPDLRSSGCEHSGNRHRWVRSGVVPSSHEGDDENCTRLVSRCCVTLRILRWDSSRSPEVATG